MSRRMIAILSLLLLVSCCACPPLVLADGPNLWYEAMLVEGDESDILPALIGGQAGLQDGYDGQTPEDLSAFSGVVVRLYRQNGPSWQGPTGLYRKDYESPIPAGGSKTWWDIYLWSQNYVPVAGNTTVIYFTSNPPYSVPWQYWGLLTLDYVPPECNWTGPYSFWIRMYVGNVVTLPVAVVTDPLQGTRMHFTVYTTPEPTSLFTLLLALAGVGVGMLRRRRR